MVRRHLAVDRPNVPVIPSLSREAHFTIALIEVLEQFIGERDSRGASLDKLGMTKMWRKRYGVFTLFGSRMRDLGDTESEDLHPGTST
jgi:hypothetical protein